MATSQKLIRIGVGQFAHETCTFCPTPTGVDEWEFYGPQIRGDAVLEAGSYIRGFASRAVDRCLAVDGHHGTGTPVGGPGGGRLCVGGVRICLCGRA